MEGLGRQGLVAAALGLVMLVGLQSRPGEVAASVVQRPQADAQRACIYDHQSLQTAPGTCRPHAKAYPARLTSAVQRAIYDGALTFGLPYKVLYKIAVCESGLNPKASNGTHFGLYQFAPDTFHRAVGMMRLDTGVQAHSYWSALDSAYTAAFLFATGESRSWTCELVAAKSRG